VRNTPVSLTASPSAGYRFSQWAGDIAGQTTNPFNITLNTDKSVSSVFVKLCTLKVTGVYGSVSGIGPVSVHDSGASVLLAAMPDPGFRVVAWTGDVEDTASQVNITLNSNKAVSLYCTNFKRITFHSSVVFNGKMWVIGGLYAQSSDSVSDKIYNSTDGLAWNIAAIVDKGHERHSSVVFDNKVWLIGGWDKGGLAARRTVSSSLDGVIWQQLPGEPLPDPINSHETIVYNSKMWNIGGGYDYGKKIVSSVDGAVWTETGTNALPCSLAHNACVVFDNKMFTIAGSVLPNTGYDATMVLSSSDGISWSHEGDLPEGLARHAAIVYNDKIWVIGAGRIFLGGA
jgi:hypothetical protein